MKFNRDYFNNPTIPDYILCKANKERVGIIKCTAKNIVHKFNDLDEITFTTYMNIDGKKNPSYEAIDTMKYILLPDIGFFSICECKTRSEGTEFEHKEVTARSYECLMAQKHVENFIINMGTTGSIDQVSFFNLADKEHSLLHLILSEKCPDWKIGHLDTSLVTMQRSFEVTRKNIYLFLMEDVAQAFGCVFLFDTLTNTINIYKEENVGEDTNVYISYNNLLKSTEISSNTDDIKTSLTLKGADDLTVREVNMGQDTIINIDFYHSTDFMSQNLYDSYGKWKVLRESKVNEYNVLLSQYQEYYSQINYLTNKKMPDTVGSTNWAEYGLMPLKEQLSAYEQKQAVMMKSGWGNTDNPYYSTSYLPVYNTIQEINAQIKVIDSELEKLNTEQTEIYNQMFDIMNLIAMENNFTEDELAELSTFIREDELSSDNYIVTDTMTDEERFEMLEDFLEYGQRELAKVATPQLAFTADMANIFAIPEFESLYDQFDVGNYIWISLRDDYHVKTRISEIDYDFYNPENFTVKFGNIVKQSGNVFYDMSEAIRQAKDAATSVSFNKSTWSQSAKDTDNIGQMLESGLLDAGVFLASGVDSELYVDSRGIFINTVTGEYAGKDSIFLGGGKVLFTDDNWKTVAMAVGRGEVKGESRFGVFADFCIASYIAGSTIEGGSITGTTINNGNGTFSVDENGHMIASSGEFKGEITASKISGSKITGTSINNGNGTFSVDKDGNLIATSADIKGKISASEIIGSSINNGNGTFTVDSSGKIHAISGNIGGAILASDSIKASNGKWAIYSDGSASFKEVFVTGVQNGSNFGGVNIGNNGWTSGTFNNGFSADTSFGVSGGALTNFNTLVTNRITAEYIDATVQLSAKYATITSLDAVSARVGTIEANYATVGDLAVTNNLVVGVGNRVTTIENNYIRTDTVYAKFMEVKNWTSAGLIRADKIEAKFITTDDLEINSGGIKVYSGGYSWFMARNSTIGNYVSWS